MKISYDYSELLFEINSDIAEELIDTSGDIWIIRDDEPVYENYKPIVDYYYINDLKLDNLYDSSDGFKAIKLPVSKVLDEMNELNRII